MYKRVNQFVYPRNRNAYVPPQAVKVSTIHMSVEEVEALKSIASASRSSRNVVSHPVTDSKEGLRKAHRDSSDWDERDGAGNGWKEHRAVQYR
jgi:hypothetical protein